MKIVGVREARRDFVGYVRKAQEEPVLVTRHGKPAVLISGVQGEELEDLLTASDPDFWKMIAARRRTPASKHVPLADVRRRLLGEPPAPARGGRRAPTSPRPKPKAKASPKRKRT